MLNFANSQTVWKDWGERLKVAIDLDFHLEYDDEVNASYWHTCAVGERDKELRNLLRYETKSEDAIKILKPEVIEMGNKFIDLIYKNHRRSALSLYRKIKAIPENEFYLRVSK